MEAKSLELPPAKATILVVDDEEPIRFILKTMLEAMGYSVLPCGNAECALSLLPEREVDIAILDIMMPGMDGMTLLSKITAFPNPPVCIMLTSHIKEEFAVQATRLGAFDFLTKPIMKDQLVLSIARAQEYKRLDKLKERLSHQIRQTPTYAGLIGQSAAMMDMFRLISQVAASNATVLITGESGTGKEKVARAIHATGARREKRFNVLDCASIPEGLMESTLFGHKKGAFTSAISDYPGVLGHSDKGTLFLDEIGELPLLLQSKLLRVLQERCFTPVGSANPISIDVRIIAATNRDLEKEVREGRFREDLFYRLNVVSIHVPPLRERRDDVVGLAKYFFAEMASDFPHVREITPHAYECLRQYPWPGNVRELRNAIEYAMNTSGNDQIDLEDLPQKIREFTVQEPSVPAPGGAPAQSASVPSEPLGDLDIYLTKMKRQYVQQILMRNKGNVSQAAREANVTRKTFYNMLNELGIESSDFRE